MSNSRTKKNQPDRPLALTRGLTTLQLLELAHVATVNWQRYVDRAAGKMEEGDYTNSSVIYDVLERNLQAVDTDKSESGKIKITNPSRTDGRARPIKYLGTTGTGSNKIAKDFGGSSGENARRAITDFGMAIEKKRGVILNYLLRPGAVQTPNGQNLMSVFIANQAAYPMVRGVKAKKGDPDLPLQANKGNRLDKVLTTSYHRARVANKEVTPTFNEYIQLLDQVFKQQEPEPRTGLFNEPNPPVSSRSAAVLTAQSAGTVINNQQTFSGFLHSNVVKFFLATVRRTNAGGRTSPADAFRAALIPLLQQQGYNNAALPMQKESFLNSLSPAQSHQIMTQAVAQSGNNIWAAIGNAQNLQILLGDLNLGRPSGADGKRLQRFPYDDNNGREVAALNLTQQTVGQIWAAYQQRGAADLRTVGSSNRKVAREARAKRVADAGFANKGRGVLGKNDPDLVKLDANTPASLVGFVRKAIQNQYSPAALAEGAKKLGMQIPENPINSSLQTEMLVEGLLQRYLPALESRNFGALSVATVALGIKGFGAVSNQTEANNAFIAVRNNLDARRGVLSAACGVDGKGKATAPLGLSTYWLKYIMKANNIMVKEASNIGEMCSVLSSRGLMQQPRATLAESLQRSVQETAPRVVPKGEASSGGRSSGRRQAVPVAPLDLPFRASQLAAAQQYAGQFQPQANFFTQQQATQLAQGPGSATRLQTQQQVPGLTQLVPGGAPLPSQQQNFNPSNLFQPQQTQQLQQPSQNFQVPPIQTFPAPGQQQFQPTQGTFQAPGNINFGQ